ncbi:type I secretion system permease/ATPase [Arhodomonas sp. SL1]|uniref:type I secretion system permease/ATPase n=1 Tax=Arhodomonas sp. SL1 TaxID=3425691 RepID=UPI003F883230
MKRNSASGKDNELKEALRACRSAFTTVGVFSLFINLLMLLPAIYMLQVYDRVMSSQSLETLAMITLIIVIMFVVMGVLQVMRSRILNRVSVQLDRNLSERVFDAMFRESLERPGSDSAQAMSDANTLRQFLTGQGLLAFFDAPWIPVYLAVMFLFHFWMGIYGVAALVVLTTLAVINELVVRKPLAAANQSDVEARRFATDNMRNAEVVHAMGMDPAIRERLGDYQTRTLEHQTYASDRAGTFSHLSRTFRMGAQALAYGVGALLAIRGEVSAGAIVAGAILMGQGLRPVDQLIGSWRQIGGAMSAYQRLVQLLENHPPRHRSMSLPPPQGAWQFDRVVAGPPATRQPTLRGISMSVEPGEVLAVIGPSASGKSTLARAGLGVWPIFAGSVRLDGAEIGQYNRDELGPHIGYLPQDIELFNGTVAENIARFGEVDSDAVVEAARLAGVDELIRHLPNGYDTMVGSGGGTLSAGQRQRVALARAVYGNPRLIVLDEPNSNLDDQGEQALVEAIVRLRANGASVMVITHRRSILGRVDKILVLRDGQMAAYGSRDDVLAKLSPGQKGEGRAAVAGGQRGRVTNIGPAGTTQGGDGVTPGDG